MAPQQKADGASGKALTLVNEILDRGLEGVPPLTSSEELAAEYSADASYRTTRDRIAALIRWEATKNFATGFATGVGGVATLPIAIPAALVASWRNVSTTLRQVPVAFREQPARARRAARGLPTG